MGITEILSQIDREIVTLQQARALLQGSPATTNGTASLRKGANASPRLSGDVGPSKRKPVRNNLIVHTQSPAAYHGVRYPCLFLTGCKAAHLYAPGLR